LRLPGKSRARWASFLILVTGFGTGYYLWARTEDQPISPGPHAGEAASQGAPVVTVRAQRGNIGVYVTALGSVTPVYTVTVKSRVDGQLMAVRYKEGQMVQQGAALAEIDPRPYQAQLQQYQGQLQRDQALLQNAKVDLTRYETLMKTNAVPEQQYATQKASVAQYEGQVEIDKGLIKATELNISYCHITAPISGLVGLRLVDPGNFVQASAGTTLLVITQMQPISVIFPIAEDQLPSVLARYRANRKLVVEGWSRDQQHRLTTGTLYTIDNQIDQTTGTVRLRATFPNKDNALFPNQFVNARLLVQQRRGVVLIPDAAIQRAGSRTFAYLVRPDSTVTVKDVHLGTTEGQNSEVTSGLQPGDELVVTGVDKLTEGAKVTRKQE
jgi:membrane fusion protein, multidrug efflux system